MLTLSIPSLSPDTSAKLEQALKSLPSVAVNIDVEHKEGQIKYDASKIGARDILVALSKLGVTGTVLPACI
jgi:hypothetical protein